MTALLIAAGTPSELPLYIVGGLLVVWAVVIAGLGITRPAFPNGARGARLVMAGSFVLMVATIAMAVVTSAFPK